MKLADDYYQNPDQYMNVFYLDEDPTVAAKLHCDKNVRKMLVATAMILSNVWHREKLAAQCQDALTIEWGYSLGAAPFGALKSLNVVLAGARIYGPHHPDHPSVSWAGLYGGNYDWLYRLGMALLDEFTYRFDRIHACTPTLRALELVPPSLLATVDTWCDAPAIMPSEYAVENITESYKTYYKKGRVGPISFTRRQPPEWLKDIAHFNFREQL